MKRADSTKKRIMDVAESIILQKGFASTSIEEIIQQAHITKGGFFYHFDGKSELAYGLLNRYLSADDEFFNDLFSRARELTEDPLQQMLLFLKLLAEAMLALEDTHPGCLVAAFTYESQQFDHSIIETMKKGTLAWRALFSEQLSVIMASRKPRLAIEIDELADMLSAVLEGGIILSRILTDRHVLASQILQYRNYLRLLFENSIEVRTDD
ncbi:TetR/AcrR family transcriptional regulator [Aliikangiella sp. G2MR2-5]|uniref:TetR/AcrR family transcriptional regulator n=1 Tax=Aliikangiella sp. G2MR2-5 TaxID=2788943 RepID=UPI0018AB96E9|nr:TetR/AcrR family transcriptional regulator [Aliikangiella sp. G2MR2-5]